MNRYVFDNNVILHFQGLRFVTKKDQLYATSGRTEYRLHWNYKGADGYMTYEKKKERDAIFNEIVKLIKKME